MNEMKCNVEASIPAISSLQLCPPETELLATASSLKIVLVCLGQFLAVAMVNVACDEIT